MEVAHYAKRAQGSPQGLLATEASGLRWLKAACPSAVVEVLDVTDSVLTLESITPAAATVANATRFGHALACIHIAGAPAFGAPPPQAPLAHGFFGPTASPLTMPYANLDRWGMFFAAYRLLPYARIAHAHQRLPTLTPFLQLAERLRAGDFDDHQPPARLHGDLWSGNLLWHHHGGTLIDPAAHGGHPLTDIATLALFGVEHFSAIIEGYQSKEALRADWQTLLPLHQLPCLLLHATLFGSGYGQDALRIAKHYLA